MSQIQEDTEEKVEFKWLNEVKNMEMLSVVNGEGTASMTSRSYWQGASKKQVSV